MYFQNDVYHKFFLQMSEEFIKIQSDLIYPCPQNLIDKYTFQNYRYVLETPEIYNEFTKPLFID